jgi:hypothetical protein
MLLRKKIAVAAAAVVLIVVIAVEIFLHTGLYSIVRLSLDQVERTFGVGLRIDKAAASLFGGTVSITGIEADNAKGFNEPRWLSVGQCRADLAVFSAIKGNMRLSDICVEDLAMVVEKNRDGQVNVQKLIQELHGTELTGIIVDDGSFDTLITYVDHEVPGQPLRLALALSIETENLSTLEAHTEDWGSFRIKGHLENDPESFVIDLHGRIAPLADIEKPTLELEGDILAIDMQKIGHWASQMGVAADAASVSVQLRCIDGRCTGTASELTVRLIKPTLAGELAERAGPVQLPSELTLTIPVYGAIDEAPQTFTRKLSEVALDSLKNEIEAASKALTEEAKQTQAALDAALKRLQQPDKGKP